jgi:hypothetical protein
MIVDFFLGFAGSATSRNSSARSENVRFRGLRIPFLTASNLAPSARSAFWRVQPSASRPSVSFTWRPSASAYLIRHTTPRAPS